MANIGVSRVPGTLDAAGGWFDYGHMTQRQGAVDAVGQLYDIIQRHIDAQPHGASVRRVAAALGVTPTTVANWRKPTKLLEKEHLEAIARVTGTPYQAVLDALLADINYDRPGAPESTEETRPA